MDGALWYCGGVCNDVMQRNTPAITCVGSVEAKKKQMTFTCKRCMVGAYCLLNKQSPSKLFCLGERKGRGLRV